MLTLGAYSSVTSNCENMYVDVYQRKQTIVWGEQTIVCTLERL